MVKIRYMVILLFSVLLHGEELCATTNKTYRFRKIDVYNGLSDNHVVCSQMSPGGVMAIRTPNTLNIYNGATFQYYRHDPKIIPYTGFHGMSSVMFDSDKRLWFKDRERIWIFDFDTQSYIYDIGTVLKPLGITKEVKNVFVDTDYNYIVRCMDNTDYFYNVASRTLTEIRALQVNNGGAQMQSMVQMGGSYWFLFTDGQLVEWNPARNMVVRRVNCFDDKSTANIASSSDNIRMRLRRSSDGGLWVMYHKGLIRYDIVSGRKQRIQGIELGGDDILTAVDIDGSDRVWLGSSRSGMRIVDGHTFQVTNLPFMALMSEGRVNPQTDISDIYIDHTGGVWISMMTEGLLYYHESMNKFSLINNEILGERLLKDENIKCIVEDVDGTILLGTINGLLRYSPFTGRMSIAHPSLANELCIGLYRDSQQRIWLGTFYNGAFCIEQGRVKQYRDTSMPSVNSSYYNQTPNNNNVRTFYEAPDGTMYISVYGGFGRIDTRSGRIELVNSRFPSIDQYMIIRNIHNINDSTLLAAADNGMFFYMPIQNRVITADNNPRLGFSGTKFNCTITDSRGLVWFGTFDGLYIWNQKTDKTTNFGADNGLTNNNILSVIEDNNGDVWIATSSSISRLRLSENGDDYTYSLSNYNTNDGVQKGEFFEHSITKSSNGTIYIGGTYGFNIINPDNIIKNNVQSTPKFIGFRLFNKPIAKGEKYNNHIILSENIEKTNAITLRHNENFITFEFSGLNYINPAQTYYRYQLENFDRQWTEINSTDGLGRATYTFLNPGRYVFKVYSANNEKVWSDDYAMIEVVVRPPIYLTRVAWIIYILSFAGAIYLTIRFWERRNRRRMELQRQEQAQLQREELNQMKFRFFTNVSHELRTPLTLIITPLDALRKRMVEGGVKEQLNTIFNNSVQLMNLVNQLLDFRKLEMKGEILHLDHGNIVEFAENVFLSFADVASGKRLNYEFKSALSSLYLEFDRAKMTKILNNLLSNAIKFTQPGNNVRMEITIIESEGRTMVAIEVSDSGIGIATEELSKIFDRFYQISDDYISDNTIAGSGIGLHIVKEYVEIHEGVIEAFSEGKGMGSTFKVLIPVDLTDNTPHPYAQQQEEATEQPEQRDDTLPTLSKLLFVEDNDEFRKYLTDELKSHYTVIEARNGEQGLEKAAEYQPDIIISDAMMPVMDGFEMCNRVKNSIETSHIPIIILTARSSDTARMTGYEAGADAFLSKPFSLDMLLVRIRNLIEQRQKRVESFNRNLEVNPSQITITSLDEQLIKRALECVERNMDNPDYSVEELSSDVSMHRMNLYRKLQSIVGQTPTEFIRSIRLKRAAQLLRQGQLPVYEVAEMVGYNNAKYFTRHFKEAFGVTPSQYGEK